MATIKDISRVTGLGIATISKYLNGGTVRTKNKEAIEKAFYGPVTPEVPASILQMHPDVILIGDKAALAKIL